MEDPANREHRNWGKRLQALNLGFHKLGSRGYVGKRPVWEKQDKDWVLAGKPNPFSEFKDQQQHDFVRARYEIDPKIEEFVTNPKVKNLEKELHEQNRLESQGSSQGTTPKAPWDTDTCILHHQYSDLCDLF